ncbi:hypothetical protein B0H63DRAFT_101589 [Podospora didyma]|uniref:Uncharacterized protein n=1 Tax=Podospora didyma TaxID=330526 RepID=A0AAE0U3J9_9PEZI|nr:hypothetical protein B0H63DRAFT_101589 [Podospora didyma]
MDNTPLPLVVLLIASIAIGWVILTLLRFYNGPESKTFLTIKSVISKQTSPVYKSHTLLGAYFIALLSETRFFASLHSSPMLEPTTDSACLALSQDESRSDRRLACLGVLEKAANDLSQSADQGILRYALVPFVARLLAEKEISSPQSITAASCPLSAVRDRFNYICTLDDRLRKNKR